MPKISLNMITQRSIEEGAAMEKGKLNPDYFVACTVCEMNPEDMKKAGIWKNTNVRVTSECGSVIVKAITPTQFCPPGLALIRQGVWANQVVPPRTQSTGVPQYSGFPVTIEPAQNERLRTALELVQGAVGLWKGGK
ncbi:MAG: molybdopterin dinucleotide-binding protein [Methanoregula sp.]|jgi:formylmethanofuran dehydrogenase subunit D|nr:molybdopterin dinucleotide-binding protein [Methanoregula sp.]